MTHYLLDANILSSLIREKASSPVLRRIEAVGPQSVCTSIIVVSEILYGVAKRRSQRLERDVAEVFENLICHPFEPPADRIYAQIRAETERRGTLLGANDLFIAAHCLALDATLVTHNTREFARVPGLRIEDWLAP